MKDKKHTGSFYTPQAIADFLVDYLFVKLKDKTSITALEPSAGDGVFIKSIFNHSKLSKKIKQVIAVEQKESEIEKIIASVKDKRLKVKNTDFLLFQEANLTQFDLVIGNPPYFKKSLLSEKQKRCSMQIFEDAKLSYKSAKNIWAAFFVRSISFVKHDGILALILPSDLKQVSYAKELRELLKKEFDRVEIFTFKELLFKDCKGQDTLLLIGQRKSRNKGVFTFEVQTIRELENRTFLFTKEIRLSENKWNHNHLSSDEFSFIAKVQEDLKLVRDYAYSKPGIVTGANSYFILNRTTVKEYELEKFVKPIIQSGAYVNGSAVFEKKDINKMLRLDKPSYLLHIDNSNEELLTDKNREYFRIEQTIKLRTRYKIGNRHVWYKVPNVSKCSEGLFFKRSHDYPKLLRNDAKILSTDSAYYINPYKGYDINSFIYSFYNSFTLALAELTGRYYGGGVLEMVPSEFKSLPIPYTNIDNKCFSKYIIDFKDKVSIEEILQKNDLIILKNTLNISLEEISKIQKIRAQLVAKRLRLI